MKRFCLIFAMMVSSSFLGPATMHCGNSDRKASGDRGAPRTRYSIAPPILWFVARFSFVIPLCACITTARGAIFGSSKSNPESPPSEVVVDTPLGRIIGRRTVYQPLEEDSIEDDSGYTASDLAEGYAHQSSITRWLRRQTSIIKRLLHDGAKIVRDGDAHVHDDGIDDITHRENRKRGLFSSLLSYIRRLLVQGLRSGVNFVSLRSERSRSKRAVRTLSFLGIPYALPPIGKLRFQPSVGISVANKNGWSPMVLNATFYAPECMQSQIYNRRNPSFTNTSANSHAGHTSTQRNSDKTQRPVQGEDCLYLNIWMPDRLSVSSNDRGSVSDSSRNRTFGQDGKSQLSPLLPVMVWIHGGAFMHGGSSKPVYVGEHLAQIGQVIVVTFNYRVGALGFLAAPQAGLFGNYGLHDQLLAIEWVYENIAYFGGDSHRITIFGESAGAMSVGLHLLDDSKRRMFNGLILQSNPYGYHYRSITVAGFIGDSYLRALDCNTLTCLQSEPLDELIRSQDALIAMPRSIGDFFSWGPVVTESSEYKRLVAYYPRAAVSNVVVKQPLEELRNLRNLSHVPIIIGVNANEGVLFVHTMFPYVVGRTLYKSMLYMFYRRAAQLVMNQYEDVVFDMLQRSVQSGRKPDYRDVLSEILGDYLFRCPNQLAARLLHNAGSAVYYYEFAMPTLVAGYPACAGLACHTAELPIVFGNLPAVYKNKAGLKRPSGSLESAIYVGDNSIELPPYRHFAELSQAVMTAWTNFAHSGNPNSQHSASQGRVQPDASPSILWPELIDGISKTRKVSIIEAGDFNSVLGRSRVAMIEVNRSRDNIVHSGDAFFWARQMARGVLNTFSAKKPAGVRVPLGVSQFNPESDSIIDSDVDGDSCRGEGDSGVSMADEENHPELDLLHVMIFDNPLSSIGTAPNSKLPRNVEHSQYSFNRNSRNKFVPKAKAEIVDCKCQFWNTIKYVF